MLVILFMLVQPAAATDDLSEIVVTSQRKPQLILQHAGNINRLDAEMLVRVQHQHIHELLNRAAGVWVVRGSGQEHQTAMRSPVLGGAGACGGIPDPRRRHSDPSRKFLQHQSTPGAEF